jgi:hypothetical protein
MLLCRLLACHAAAADVREIDDDSGLPSTPQFQGLQGATCEVLTEYRNQLLQPTRSENQLTNCDEVLPGASRDTRCDEVIVKRAVRRLALHPAEAIAACVELIEAFRTTDGVDETAQPPQATLLEVVLPGLARAGVALGQLEQVPLCCATAIQDVGEEAQGIPINRCIAALLLVRKHTHAPHFSQNQHQLRLLGKIAIIRTFFTRFEVSVRILLQLAPLADVPRPMASCVFQSAYTVLVACCNADPRLAEARRRRATSHDSCRSSVATWFESLTARDVFACTMHGDTSKLEEVLHSMRLAVQLALR